MTTPFNALPTDLAAAHAMILAERAARLSAETRADTARAKADAAIAHLRLEIEKLRRALYGVRSERKARRPTPIAAITCFTIRCAKGAVISALCWAHARRQFFELADIAANARRGEQAPAISPIALEAVKRIDALFDIERSINGLPAGERLRVRLEQSAPLLADPKA